MRKQYDFSDICVACGAPTTPGEQICWSCQQTEKELAEPENETTGQNRPTKKPIQNVPWDILFEKP